MTIIPASTNSLYPILNHALQQLMKLIFSLLTGNRCVIVQNKICEIIRHEFMNRNEKTDSSKLWEE